MAVVVGAVEGVVASEMEEALFAKCADEEDVVGVSRDLLIKLSLGDMFVVCEVSCRSVLVVVLLIL
jgi:hypothetical protein